MQYCRLLDHRWGQVRVVGNLQMAGAAAVPPMAGSQKPCARCFCTETPGNHIFGVSGAKSFEMTGGQVIRATQMFTKHGQSTKVSVLKEIGMGLSLGLAFGLVWKVG